VLSTGAPVLKNDVVAWIHPNPSKDILMLSFFKDGEEIIVENASFFDLSGRLVLEIHKPQSPMSHGLDAGVYFVLLKANNAEMATFKLVVQQCVLI
jgi:hypothetical protein